MDNLFNPNIPATDKPGIYKVLAKEEDVREQPYKDSLGNYSIGIGHLIGRDFCEMKLTPREMTKLAEADVEEAWSGIVSVFGEELPVTWEPARQAAIVSLMFQLGEVKFRKFENLIAHIKNGHWRAAGASLKDTRLAMQAPNRTRRVAGMLVSGVYDEYYG